MNSKYIFLLVVMVLVHDVTCGDNPLSPISSTIMSPASPGADGNLDMGFWNSQLYCTNPDPDVDEDEPDLGSNYDFHLDSLCVGWVCGTTAPNAQHGLSTDETTLRCDCADGQGVIIISGDDLNEKVRSLCAEVRNIAEGDNVPYQWL